jgi:DNA-binding transcriptional regulator YdaS (Cro superfamily)
VTPDELRSCMRLMGWTSAALAVLVGRSDAAVRHWVHGRNQVPDDVAAWIEGVVRYVVEHPPPRWRAAAGGLAGRRAEADEEHDVGRVAHDLPHARRLPLGE